MIVSETQKQIIQLLADGQFHSGTELADAIGISRSAICKQLKTLSEIGLEFNAISGKGYCLQHALQLLSKQCIENDLNPDVKAFIRDIEIHDCINSTNIYLLEKARQSQQQQNHRSGTVCLAEYQTAGKGRRGRQWISPFGSNIYLSILWSFQNGPATINGLSLAIGVAVLRALNQCGIQQVGLKWPNDIYWQNKKLAGILIEVSGEVGGCCDVVIGLGLNFYIPQNKAESITQDWVDLNQILDKDARQMRNKLLAVLLNHLLPTLASFEQLTLTAYLDQWRQYDCMKGKAVNIYMGKQMYSGVVQGIDDAGLLILKDEQGKLKSFASGEVSFRQV